MTILNMYSYFVRGREPEESAHIKIYLNCDSLTLTLIIQSKLNILLKMNCTSHLHD